MLKYKAWVFIQSFLNIQVILISGQSKLLAESEPTIYSQYAFSVTLIVLTGGRSNSGRDNNYKAAGDLLSIVANTPKDQMAVHQFKNLAFEDRLGPLEVAVWNTIKNI